MAAIGGALGIILSQSTIALAESQPSAEVPAYYVGAGIRGGKGDATAAVIDSKIKLTDLGDLTLSTRPALLMGAYNMDDLGEVDPMLTGGLDMPLNRRLIVNLTINFIWQSDISDDDTEFLATLNYGF